MGNMLDMLKKNKEAMIEMLADYAITDVSDENHIKSPIRGESNGSCSLFKKEDTGHWLLRDHVLDKSYDIIGVIMAVEEIPFAEAAAKCVERYGYLINRTDMDPATAFTDTPARQKGFRTVKDAEAWLRRKNKGVSSQRFIYDNPGSKPFMAVVRINLVKGKKIMPFHREGDRWIAGDPEGLLPLYNLDEIHSRPGETVIVVEGEKDARRLNKLGFLATTSAHGAKSASRTDWTPLAGRELIAWRDFDGSGQGYQNDFTSIVTSFERPAIVKAVDVTKLSLPEGGDVVDFIEAMGPLSKAEIRRRIKAVLDSAVQAWAGGVDLTKCGIDVRLRDPDLFKLMTYVSTGFREIDLALGGGLALGECSCLFAPASAGKTTTIFNVALHCAKQQPTAVISLEMPAGDLAKLALGIEANVPRSALRSGKLSNDEQRRCDAAQAKMKDMKLFIVDRHDAPTGTKDDFQTMESLERIIRDGVKRCGWKVVIIDYLTKLGPFNQDELVRVARLTDWIFHLAQSLRIHVIALMQSNKLAFGQMKKKKKGELPRPSLQNAKGPVETVANFDNCLAITQEAFNTGEDIDSVPMTIWVLKARQARGGHANFNFIRSIGKIEEVLRQETKIKEVGEKVAAKFQARKQAAKRKRKAA